MKSESILHFSLFIGHYIIVSFHREGDSQAFVQGRYFSVGKTNIAGIDRRGEDEPIVVLASHLNKLYSYPCLTFGHEDRDFASESLLGLTGEDLYIDRFFEQGGGYSLPLSEIVLC